MPRLTFAAVRRYVKIIPFISAGDSFALLTKFASKAWGWGLNTSGQVGDNSVEQENNPASVCGAVKTFCKISAGNSHSLAIDKNGRAWSWGSNSIGQLGDFTAVNSKSTPVSVCGTVRTFCNIDAGTNYSLAIDKFGRTWGWGSGLNGRIGDNGISNRSTPVLILGVLKTFCHISAGGGHSLSIDKYGISWCWGLNTSGQLGNDSLISVRTPYKVGVFGGPYKTFCTISAGGSHSLAIDKNGRAWSWGLSSSGQLGDNNTTTNKRTPVSVCGAVKTFCKISGGASHSLAIDKNGRAWSWGLNSSGQLGDNSVTNKSTPVSVCGTVKTFCEISAGNNFSIAVDKNGNVWSWGLNTNGQLGAYAPYTPLSVCGAVKTFCHISAGGTHSGSIDKNGRLWSWADNVFGQLGDNSTTNKSTPVSVCGAVKTFCAIDYGIDFSVAIDKNGRVWGWGRNNSGELGDISTVSKSTPVSVCGAVKTFCKITTGGGSGAGGNYVMAIDKNGRAWGWGAGGNGRLGDNQQGARCTPISVCGTVKTFCHIAAGFNNSTTAAIDKNGRAWAWGNNLQGGVGDNSTTNKSTPVSVCGAVKTFCKIDVSQTVLSIDKNGRLWSWGSALNGILGDNSLANKSTPVSVCGAVKTFCEISISTTHALAIDKNGRLWSWGSNTNGSLGNNSLTNRSTPVSVCGAVKTFCKISAGINFSIAVDKDGRAWAWGLNSTGQLGRGNPLITPIMIPNI